MVHTIVGYPSRGQAPEIPAMRLKSGRDTVKFTVSQNLLIEQISRLYPEYYPKDTSSLIS